MAVAPVVIAGISAAASIAGGIVGGATALIISVFATVITFGVQLASIRPSPNIPSNDNSFSSSEARYRHQVFNFRHTISPRVTIYGTARVGMSIVHIDSGNGAFEKIIGANGNQIVVNSTEVSTAPHKYIIDYQSLYITLSQKIPENYLTESNGFYTGFSHGSINTNTGVRYYSWSTGSILFKPDREDFSPDRAYWDTYINTYNREAGARRPQLWIGGTSAYPDFNYHGDESRRHIQVPYKYLSTTARLPGTLPIAKGDVLYVVKNTPREYLGVIGIIAGHPIESIEKVINNEDDEVLWDKSLIGVDGNTDGYTGAIPRQYFKFEHRLDGVSPLSTDGKEWLPAAPEGKENKLTNCAVVRFILYREPKYYKNFPSFSFIVKGKKIKDVRTPNLPVAFSDNPVNVINDILKSLMGYNDIDFDETQLISAANECDRIINYIDEGITKSRKQYTVSLWFKSDEEPKSSILPSLQQAINGYIIDSEQALRIIPGTPSAPVFHIKDEHILKFLEANDSKLEIYNTVQGTFFNENDNYKPAEFPVVESKDAVKEDGGRRSGNVDYRCVTNSNTVQQITSTQLARDRLTLQLDLACDARTFFVLTGQTVLVSYKKFKIENKIFRCLATQKSLRGLGNKLILKEENPEVWAWDSNSGVDLPISDNIFLPQPNLVNFPTNVNVSFTAYKGRAIAVVNFETDVNNLVYVKVVNAELVVDDDGNRLDDVSLDYDTYAGIETNTRNSSTDISGLTVGSNYYIVLKSINAIGFESPSTSFQFQMKAPTISKADLSFIDLTEQN